MGSHSTTFQEQERPSWITKGSYMSGTTNERVLTDISLNFDRMSR